MAGWACACLAYAVGAVDEAEVRRYRTAQALPPPEPPVPVYKVASEPVERRVEDLLARMTLEEKVAQMVAIWL